MSAPIARTVGLLFLGASGYCAYAWAEALSAGQEWEAVVMRARCLIFLLLGLAPIGWAMDGGGSR